MRLAVSGAPVERRGLAPVADYRAGRESRPAILVSFFYFKVFCRVREMYGFRDWALDSGAYSAYNSGVSINLEEYIEACLRLMETDSMLTEVFALDVIGDWRASAANTEKMWAAGVPAIPTYHLGEPEAHLLDMAERYPKIALGGAVGVAAPTKIRWASQCFGRLWPKRIHGLGFGSEKAIMALPFHSVDASNWQIGPAGYGQWKTFGTMSVPGGGKNIRAEVEWYLDLERRANIRWKNEMAELESLNV